jgi:hypothetical protein
MDVCVHLTLRKEHTLRVYYKWMVQAFGPKRAEEAGGSIKL